MEILHVISSSALLGAERVICELVTASEAKMHVCLLGARPSLVDEFRECLGANSPRLHNIECGGKVSLTALSALRALIKEHRFKIVHSHGYKADTMAFVVKSFALPELKLVASCHNWMLNTLNEKIYKALDLFLLRKFDAVVAVSREIEDQLSSARVKSYLEVVDNGVDLRQFKAPPDRDVLRASLGIEPDDIVVGCVASLTPEKRQQDLIDAVTSAGALSRKLKLVLVGDGPCREELERKAAAGTGNVLFLGHRKDARSIYFAFDIFALVSGREGLPMALLEAMAARLPVVASSVGAIPAVIRNGVNGLLIPSGAVQEISSAIDTLAADDQLRCRLAAAGSDTIAESYSSRSMCKKYQSIYSRLLAGKA